MPNVSKEKKQVFNKHILEKISTPEDLTEYLKVTDVGVWTVLLSVIFLAIGVFAWSVIGTLETTADAKIVVKNNQARVVISDDYVLDAGDTVRIPGKEFAIASLDNDEFGRQVGKAVVTVPDGKYEGVVVVGKFKPIDFLTQSR